MTHIKLLFAAICAGFALHAAAELKVVEMAVEANTESTLLPSGPTSSLVVTPCKSCNPLTLPVTASTRYFVGNEVVSLTELKRRLANRPKSMLVILYRKDSRELTRVIAPALKE